MIKIKYTKLIFVYLFLGSFASAEESTLNQVEVKPGISEIDLIEEKKQKQLPQQNTNIPDNSINELTIYLKDINIIGNTVFSPEELRNIYKQYVDKMISAKDLDSLTLAISEEYHKKGYFLTIVLPEYNPEEPNIINIKILEGAIKFHLLGDKYNNKLLNKYIKNIEDCIPITKEIYERNIELIDKIPGINYESKVGLNEEAIKSGSPHIMKIFFLNNPNEIEGKFYFDNSKQNKTQTPLTIYNSTQLNNVFNYNETLKLVFETSGSFSKKRDISLSLTKPVNDNGLLLSISASSRKKTNTEKVNLIGCTNGLSISDLRGVITDRSYFDIKIINNPILSFNKKLSTSFGYKLTNLTQRKKASTDIIDKYTVPQIYLNANYYFKDKFQGDNYLNTSLGTSYKFMGTKNYKLASKFQDFTILSADYVRRDSYKYNLVSIFQLDGQVSNKSLPGVEQFSYGGGDFGKAYGQAIISGDSGFNSSMKLLKLIHKKNNKQIYLIAPYAYIDAGVVSSKNVAKKSAASSVGAGVELFMRNGLKFGYSLNKPLHVKNVPDIRKNKINHVVTFMAEYKF